MKLLTIKESSEKWGLSERTIRKLCIEERIPEAELIRGIWMIPEDAYKPERKPPQKQEKQTVPLSPLARQVISQRRRNNHYGIYEHIQVYLTYSSNRMASNRLTKKAIEEIYRKNNITTSFEPAKVDDIIETINHFEAVRYIIDHIEDDLTPIFIQHLHQILTYGTYADRKAKLQPGALRTDDSKKGIAPAKISKEIISLCKTYEKNPVTIERILEFHVRFEKIHPFKDYNGRIGRLIMMKECLRFGITPFIIDDKWSPLPVRYPRLEPGSRAHDVLSRKRPGTLSSQSRALQTLQIRPRTGRIRGGYLVMFRRKRKYYLVLTLDEAHLALHAMLSFRNKVVARGIDAVDVDVLIKKLPH